MKRIFVILLIISSLSIISISVAIYNSIMIEDVKEETFLDISLLNSRVAELTENTELLEAKTLILEEQQQSLTQQEYDFLIYKQNKTSTDSSFSKYFVKSGLNGAEIFEMPKFSDALVYALEKGNSVILSFGTYELHSDVVIEKKSNMILDGQGSIINQNGFSISFISDSHENNTNNQIQNFIIRNGTIRLENSFRATLQNMVFQDCKSAIEISNTNTWSEATKLENIYWENCQTGLTFKTPTNNGTGSYENTALDRCYFNLHRNNSVAIMIEQRAEVSNSLWTDMRIWLHAINNQTQTGLHLEGAMTETQLNDVIFESFGNGTIYGIYIGEHSITGVSPGAGTTFIGTFTARISNDQGRWILGKPSIFKIETELNSTQNNAKIQRDPLTISNFDAFINITDFGENEEIIFQIKLNFIDHTDSSIVINSTDKKLIEGKPYWLTKEDMYELYPSQNMVWNIEITVLTPLQDPQTEIIFGVICTAR